MTHVWKSTRNLISLSFSLTHIRKIRWLGALGVEQPLGRWPRVCDSLLNISIFISGTMTPSLWQLTQHFYLYLWDDDPESVTAYLTFLYYLWRRRLLSICLNHRIYTVEKPPITPISLSYTLFLLINLTYIDLILGKRSYRLLSFAAHTTHTWTTSWVTDLKCVTRIENFYTVTSLTT